MLITSLSSLFLLINSPFSGLGTTEKNPVKPIRHANTHYRLVQQWKDVNGQEQETKICEGDTLAPVVKIGDNETIGQNDWINVDCVAQSQPAAGSGKASESVTVRMNFFVIFMDVNIFSESKKTKNFVSFTLPQNRAETEVGFSSSEDLTVPTVSYPSKDRPAIDEANADTSTYVVAAGFADYGAPPSK